MQSKHFGPISSCSSGEFPLIFYVKVLTFVFSVRLSAFLKRLAALMRLFVTKCTFTSHSVADVFNLY